MTTDNIKDLLIAASRKAKYILYSIGDRYYFDGTDEEWQPHLDDGDCLRLADALGMDIIPNYGGGGIGCVVLNTKQYIFTPHNLLELRMAVLRAAAGINERRMMMQTSELLTYDLTFYKEPTYYIVLDDQFDGKKLRFTIPREVAKHINNMRKEIIELKTKIEELTPC